MAKDSSNTWVDQQSALSRLVGARLTSVQFVLNYLVLGFDEKGALTTLVWPLLIVGGRPMTFGTPGYRDELCSLIEETVESASIDGDEVIKFRLQKGREMAIELKSYRNGGERAILTGPKHFLYVF